MCMLACSRSIAGFVDTRKLTFNEDSHLLPTSLFTGSVQIPTLISQMILLLPIGIREDRSLDSGLVSRKYNIGGYRNRRLRVAVPLEYIPVLSDC